MKKVFFSCAIAAMGLLLASCGNKAEANNNGDVQQNLVTVEQTDSASVAENDYIKVNVPAGWEVEKNESKPRTICLNLKPSTELGKWQYVSIFTDNIATDSEDWKNFAKSCAESKNRSLVDDVTFAGVTFKQVKFTNSADVSCMLYGKMPKGTLEITVSEKLTLDNSDVKAILESISFK